MTILELLDQLEAEIVALRGRVRELENHSAHAHQPEPKTRKAVKKKAKPKKAANRERPINEVQMELPVESDSARTVGKRQALGRSIIQLRRSSPRAKLSENSG